MELLKLVLPNVTQIVITLITAVVMLKVAKIKSARENLSDSTSQKMPDDTSRPREIELQYKISQIKADCKNDLRKARGMFWLGLALIAFNGVGLIELALRSGSPSRWEVVSLCNGVVNCWLQFALALIWLRDWLAWRKLLAS